MKVECIPPRCNPSVSMDFRAKMEVQLSDLKMEMVRSTRKALGHWQVQVSFSRQDFKGEGQGVCLFLP